MRLRQDLLKHEGVHHAILEQMQGEHADFIILAALLTISPRRAKKMKSLALFHCSMDIAG